MTMGPKSCTAKLERPMFLAQFLLLNVVLLASDIFTDVLRGIDLIVRGNWKYGCATIWFIFMPMFAEMFLRVSKGGVRCRYICGRPRLSLSKQKLKNFFWTLPLLQPVRYKISMYKTIQAFLMSKININQQTHYNVYQVILGSEALHGPKI